MNKLLYITLIALLASCIGASNHNGAQTGRQDSTTIVTATNISDTTTVIDTTLIAPSPKQVDSLIFRLTHHYSENFNFKVKADSLTLIPRDGDLAHDTCQVYKGDIIVVASIRTIPGSESDSTWVKVASSQHTMGWITEEELLQGAVPDDPISEILDLLSGSRTIWMTAIALIGIFAIAFGRKRHLWSNLLPSFFHEMDSLYPALFLCLTSIMAALYASVQNFVPEFWQEYYFHPSLNPLVLPPIMATLVVMAWLLIITFIAVIDEVYHHFYFIEGITYLAKLLGLAMLIYLFISWTSLIYIGYIVLPVMLFYLGKQMLHSIKDIKH